KKDFLQILLDLKDKGDSKSINITQIKAILVDVMIAGTETTAKLSEWAMAEILKNHNVLKRVQEELAEVVGLNNIVEESHLPKLQYLDATVKETFRLHPVTPFLVPRSSSKACVFKPERFLTGKWDYNGNNLKFFPFGSGRRLCPGIVLAEKMQMFILASLLHSFNWSLPNGEEHNLSEKFGVTLEKRKPLFVIPSQRLPDVSLYM
ncbi:cytochrome P450 76C1-like protein, partial [Tanacetum coccineum]